MPQEDSPPTDIPAHPNIYAVWNPTVHNRRTTYFRSHRDRRHPPMWVFHPALWKQVPAFYQDDRRGCRPTAFRRAFFVGSFGCFVWFCCVRDAFLKKTLFTCGCIYGKIILLWWYVVHLEAPVAACRNKTENSVYWFCLYEEANGIKCLIFLKKMIPSFKHHNIFFPSWFPAGKGLKNIIIWEVEGC